MDVGMVVGIRTYRDTPSKGIVWYPFGLPELDVAGACVMG